MVFSMQGLGLILGPLVAVLLLASGLQHDLVWRLMLALGAVPALATFYLRRQIGETPRFALMMQGDEQAASHAVQQAISNGTASASKTTSKKAHKSWDHLLLRPRFLLWLIGTAGTWFLLDIAYYGTTISSPLVLRTLNPKSALITDMLYTLGIFVIAAFPGYLVSVFTIDRLGRKFIQWFGFGMMALAYGVLAIFPQLTTITLPFLLCYGMAYFFAQVRVYHLSSVRLRNAIYSGRYTVKRFIVYISHLIVYILRYQVCFFCLPIVIHRIT
jgi:MFS family permease